MNRKRLTITLLFCFSLTLLFTLSTAYAQNTSEETTEEWVMRIIMDEWDMRSTISKDEFLMVFELYLQNFQGNIEEIKNDPMKFEELKRQMLRQIKMQELMLLQAEKEKAFDTEEFRNYFRILIKQQKSQYYQMMKIQEIMEEIPEPSDEEIRETYERVKDKLAERGVTSLTDEAKKVIASQLRFERAQMKFQQRLEDLLGEARVKNNRETIDTIDSSIIKTDATQSTNTLNSSSTN